jgi:hypothetical protein
VFHDGQMQWLVFYDGQMWWLVFYDGQMWQLVFYDGQMWLCFIHNVCYFNSFPVVYVYKSTISLKNLADLLSVCI